MAAVPSPGWGGIPRGHGAGVAPPSAVVLQSSSGRPEEKWISPAGRRWPLRGPTTLHRDPGPIARSARATSPGATPGRTGPGTRCGRPGGTGRGGGGGRGSRLRRPTRPPARRSMSPWHVPTPCGAHHDAGRPPRRGGDRGRHHRHGRRLAGRRHRQDGRPGRPGARTRCHLGRRRHARTGGRGLVRRRGPRRPQPGRVDGMAGVRPRPGGRLRTAGPLPRRRDTGGGRRAVGPCRHRPGARLPHGHGTPGRPARGRGLPPEGAAAVARGERRRRPAGRPSGRQPRRRISPARPAGPPASTSWPTGSSGWRWPTAGCWAWSWTTADPGPRPSWWWPPAAGRACSQACPRPGGHRCDRSAG